MEGPLCNIFADVTRISHKVAYRYGSILTSDGLQIGRAYLVARKRLIRF